jgi:hypothetical protein
MTSRNFEDTESLKDLCAQIEHIVIDTDGVLTDGTFQYSRFGKTLKTFGSHDGRALQIAKKFFDIQMISADLRGFKITKSRARDLNIPCTYVSENERKSWRFKFLKQTLSKLLKPNFFCSLSGKLLFESTFLATLVPELGFSLSQSSSMFINLKKHNSFFIYKVNFVLINNEIACELTK